MLAVLETAGWPAADAEAKAAFAAQLEALRAAGIALIDRRGSTRVERLEQALAEAAEVSRRINDWEKLWPFAELDDRAGAGLSPGLRKDIAAGRAMMPDEYHSLLQRRDAMRDRLLTLAGEVDGCITLASLGVAPLGIESTGDAVFNLPASALRTPAISLPLMSVGRLPLGLQIIGFPQRDRELSAIAGFLLEHGALAH